ncbi:MAG: DUF485 domain-containing protein [Gemmatimonadaceae bacterium]
MAHATGPAVARIHRIGTNQTEPPATDHDPRLRALAAARWRLAGTLTAAMIAIYFGFIALIAFRKPLMGALVMPGLSLGILLGALVIVSSWLLTWWYVRWANSYYDVEVRRLSGEQGVLREPEAG